MKKWLIGLLLIGVLTTVVVPAFALNKGLTSEQQKDIGKLQQQIIDLRSQIVDKYVDAGLMTKQQGDQAKQQLQRSLEQGQNYGAVPYGPGYGCGGAGNGMMGGYIAPSSSNTSYNNTL